MTHLQASVANPASLYVANAQFNLLWPSYSLPWNNFYSKPDPNPYYLSNELSNIEYRELSSPRVFDANAQAVGVASFPVNVATVIPVFGSTSAGQSTKSFQGVSYDISTKQSAPKYFYNYNGQLQNGSAIVPANASAWIVLGLNLSVPPTFSTTISTLYQSAGGATGCAGIPCTVGPNCLSGISGFINVAGAQINLNNPIPYLNSTTGCSFNQNVTQYYTILGSRLYLIVKATNATQAPANSLIYHINVTTVESTTATPYISSLFI